MKDINEDLKKQAQEYILALMDEKIVYGKMILRAQFIDDQAQVEFFEKSVVDTDAKIEKVKTKLAAL